MKGSRFFNLHSEKKAPDFFTFLKWKLGFYKNDKFEKKAPHGFVYPGKAKTFDRNLPSVCWIGHSTFLIQIAGISFLTDPVFDSHCSPVRFNLFKRLENPAIRLEDLPKIDFVLQSHNHYDHLDKSSVDYLNDRFPNIEWIVPEGLSTWFKKRGVKNVVELKWWQKYKKITAVPTQHFSGRGLFDRDKTHWCGFVVEVGGKRIYFAGDTGYNSEDFRQIGVRFSQMDLSLIPIGTYIPQEILSPIHINPYEAVKIHQHVHSKFSLAMHWKTFKLSEEETLRPQYDLYLAMKEKNLDFNTFLPIDIGTWVNF